MLGLKMSYTIKNRKYRKECVYLVVILFLVICIIACVKVKKVIDEQRHEQWVKGKEQEFKPAIDFAYSVMKGEKNVSEESPLYAYDILNYVENQEEWNATAKIEIVDIEEMLADKKFKIIVIYTQILLDKNGKTLKGAKAHSNWIIEKGKDGKWEIVDIDELA